MHARLRHWFRFLLEPVDAASLAVFRVVFGTMMAWDAVRYVQHGWVEEYFLLPKVHFTYFFFDFVRPWPRVWMYAHLGLVTVAALLVAGGLAYRAAAVVLFLSYSYFFLLEKSVYMNHHYLMVLLSFLLVWMPAHHAWSLDRVLVPSLPSSVPRWCVWLLRFQLFVVYFYGAIAKLNADWLAGEPMYSELLRHGPDVPEIATHFPPALLAYAIAYGGILFDAAMPIMLCFRRTRWIGFLAAVLFHALNEVFLRIGVFSYLMTGAITIFFPPDWPRQLLRRLGKTPAPTPLRTTSAKSPGAAWMLLVAMHVYVLLQLAIPLRHWLYPGGVSWTEEGHRFSWHMKLRKKDSRLTIYATDPATGRRWVIDPTEDLRPRQVRKLQTFPDILIQYAHYKRDQLRAQGIEEPIITADWQCSLNGGPYEPLVDPTTNLATVEDTLRPAPWILMQGARPNDVAPATGTVTPR
jgi:hypothetical protein